MKLLPGLYWFTQRHERLSPEGRADKRESGYYIIEPDGKERGPFPACPRPDAAESAARAAEVQLLLLQEPRP